MQAGASVLYGQEQETDTTNAFEVEQKINPKKDIKAGNKYFEEFNYTQALYFYLRASKVDSLNAKFRGIDCRLLSQFCI